MGSGKTHAAITYFNEHPDGKYIYITPYLEEATRIKKECPALHFAEPSNMYKEYQHKKYLHTMALIKEGRNIATTHAAFKRYTQETLDDIRRQGYILVVDENVDVLEPFDFDRDDLQILIDAGKVGKRNDEYVILRDDYNGKALTGMFDLLKSRRLVRSFDEKDKYLFYWVLPEELFTAFKDVYVLTYLFEGQSLYYFMKMYNIPYKNIGLSRVNSKYRFCNTPLYTPDYVSDLTDMIEIFDYPKMNEIGKNKFALSMAWFKRGGDNVEQMRKHLYNYFRHIHADIPPDKKLWGAFNEAKNKIKGKGYTKAFLNFSTKATNDYRDRYCLAYPVNLFMNVGDKIFYRNHGIEANEDAYALSIMVQWIWRSAIRDGNKVQLYLPSSRMRNLLTDWIETTSKGGGLSE